MDQAIINPQVIRYSERPLPPYRHLPFRNAHPFLDEDGHSYAEPLRPPAAFAAGDWRRSAEYLYAIDLFNRGFWWEAHERLKPLSIAAGRESTTGLFLQGLIQVAAALLKKYLDEPEPAALLAEQALRNLEQAPEPPFLGVAVDELSRAVRACLHDDAVGYPVIHLAGMGIH